MVLSVTFLKDLANNLHPPLAYIIIACIGAFYLVMLTSIWFALRLIRVAARTVLTRAAQIGSGNELDTLQRHLRVTQAMFLLGLLCFAAVALCMLSVGAFSQQIPERSITSKVSVVVG